MGIFKRSRKKETNQADAEAARRSLARKLYEEINELDGDAGKINRQFEISQTLKSMLERNPDDELLYDLAFNCKDAAIRLWAVPRIVNKVTDLDLLEKTAGEYRFNQGGSEWKTAYKAAEAQLEKTTASYAEQSCDESLLLRIVLMPYGATFETRKKAISRLTNREMLEEIIAENPTPVGEAAKERLKNL